MPAIRGHKSKSKTRRLTRSIDQIKADLTTPKHLTQYKATKAAEDLPALGEFYCVECAKWFESEHNLLGHRASKVHKKRVKQLKEEAHTQQTADAAVGLQIDNGRKKDEQMNDG